MCSSKLHFSELHFASFFAVYFILTWSRPLTSPILEAVSPTAIIEN